MSDSAQDSSSPTSPLVRIAQQAEERKREEAKWAAEHNERTQIWQTALVEPVRQFIPRWIDAWRRVDVLGVFGFFLLDDVASEFLNISKLVSELHSIYENWKRRSEPWSALDYHFMPEVEHEWHEWSKPEWMFYWVENIMRKRIFKVEDGSILLFTLAAQKADRDLLDFAKIEQTETLQSISFFVEQFRSGGLTHDEVKSNLVLLFKVTDPRRFATQCAIFAYALLPAPAILEHFFAGKPTKEALENAGDILHYCRTNDHPDKRPERLFVRLLSEYEVSGAAGVSQLLRNSPDLSSEFKMPEQGPGSVGYEICRVLNLDPGILRSRNSQEVQVSSNFEKVDAAKKEEGNEGENIFRKEGKFWTLKYVGKTKIVQDALGFGYIHRLLVERGRSISAVELKSTVTGSKVKPMAGMEILDEQSREEIKKEFEDLKEDWEDAVKMDDKYRVSRIKEKMLILAEQLNSDQGLGGRKRLEKDEISNVRVSVKNAIDRALKSIESEHHELYQHLDRYITTGTSLCYKPEPDVEWNV